ncbi:MAG TPA: hypothetical protein VLZ33_03030, partial [Dysgonamonadaceae bacterium]|nr:hypothetical protein [Dysgonamonadaceae bacterium]
MFNNFKLLMALLICANGLIAQSKVTLNNVRSFEPIELHKPVLLDSVNLENEKFSETVLLKSSISIPEHNRFETKLETDSAGFFHLSETNSEYAFHLLSFYLSGDSYGKAKLTVTSPNALEVYINGERRATKTDATDSISNAGSAEATLNGMLNNSRVVVKLLAAKSNKFNSAAAKIEVKPAEEDSTLTISFSDDPSRYIGIKDILEGKRVSSSKISPSGRFVLLQLTETLSGGDTKRYVEVFDTKQKRTLIHETANRTQLKWMPKSDKLTYVADTEDGRTMMTLDPLTMEEVVIAKDLPKETFNLSPDEKSMFYSIKETLTLSTPANMKRLLAPDDRQPNYRDRHFIYQYFFDSGLSQQITFGRETASINDISSDAKQMLFSTSKEDLSERPFRKSSLYKLSLETMEVDTLWEDESFVSYAQFSPDNQQILISGSPEAFNKIGQNVNEGQIANSYDRQAYIMDLKTKRIDPITKEFYPSIDSQQWSRVDNRIYFRVQDHDRENVYRYNPKSRKYTKLNLNEDVIRAFDLANNAEWASYTGVSVSNSNRSYVINLKNEKSELISDPFNERLSQITLGDVNDWSFKSSSGDKIEGRFYLPPNFDPNKKHPLIVYYYGGTSPTQRIFESTYPLHVYAAQGYVVYT